jgi:long-chain acyl-CoA synthetase
VTLSVPELFVRVCRERRAHGAVVEGHTTVTFGELSRWADAIAAAVEQAGPFAGSRGAVVLPNSAKFVAAFMGIARAGGVVAPLDPGYRRELRAQLADMEPGAILLGEETLSSVREAIVTLRRKPALLLLDAPGRVEVLAAGDVPGGRGLPADDPPLLLLHTSGSAGPAKRVVRTHERVAAEVAALHALLGMTPADRVLGAAPFSHTNGLIRSMLTAMLAGATLYPMVQFGRRTAPALITKERLTCFGGVPPMFVALTESPPRDAVDLSSLRVVFSASAPLLERDARRFYAAHGLWIRQLYGSTETGTISYNDDPDVEGCLATVGRALPGVSLTVQDDGGTTVPVGLEGEIAVSSRFATASYDGDAEATRENFRRGWYLTRDLGRLDGQGRLTLTGRQGWLINRGGYKVNPSEVEEVIRLHPKVADVAVVGRRGPHGDDVIRCLVVLRAPSRAEDLIRHCREHIADHKIPNRIEFRNALPRTSTGKILRERL